MKLFFEDQVYDRPEGESALQMLIGIDKALLKRAVAARADGRLVGLKEPLGDAEEVHILTFDDPDGRRVFRHTASHILAQAVTRLLPGAKLAIGPAIDEGFYYDFDVEEAFTPEILNKVEREMLSIVKKNLPIERFTLSREEALAWAEETDQPYKAELIRDLEGDAVISFYRQGEFCDLCSGPHLPSTGAVKAIKITGTAGAYWRGDEHNKMLSRIYATAYPDKEALQEHLDRLEQAKLRNHNRLGRELELFTTSDQIGQGLPIMLPKGAKVLQILKRFVEDEEERRGYQLTMTPFMAKSDLYKVSGHWDHYRDGMFVLGDPDSDDEVLALRPMTCPFQFQAYLSKTRSYRDLPLRYNETSTLFRNEASGEMHGLIRLRQFTISEGHLAVRPDQVEAEFRGCLDLAMYMLNVLGLQEDVTFRFSKWDPNDREKYIGDAENWEQTQRLMREILDGTQLPYEEAEGEAAFYGPKLDIQIKNVHGKEDTLITIQIDFQLAERFEMTYTDRDGQKKFPIVIHRTSIGCYERTLALLIEKYAGAFPTWLAPVQLKVMTITDRADEAARSLKAELDKNGLRSELDLRNEKIGFKIREARNMKIPYLVILGDEEVSTGQVSVRSRDEGELGKMTRDQLIKRLVREVETKARG